MRAFIYIFVFITAVFGSFDRSLDTSFNVGGPVALAEGKPTPGKTWQLLSGQDFLELAEYDREVYVTGVNDAYNWSFMAGFERMKWLIPCVRGRQSQQLSAMFSKWLKKYPEKWHEPAAKLFPFAMFAVCRKSQTPKVAPQTPPKTPSKTQRITPSTKPPKAPSKN